MFRSLFFALALAIATTSGTVAQSRAESFLEALQRAVGSGDRRAVATLVSYPATVLNSGFNIPVKDRATLLAAMTRRFGSPKTASKRIADGPATDAGRTWSGVATGDADYRIEVLHIAPYCDPVQQYKLTITLR